MFFYQYNFIVLPWYWFIHLSTVLYRKSNLKFLFGLFSLLIVISGFCFQKRILSQVLKYGIANMSLKKKKKNYFRLYHNSSSSYMLHVVGIFACWGSYGFFGWSILLLPVHLYLKAFKYNLISCIRFLCLFHLILYILLFIIIKDNNYILGVLTWFIWIWFFTFVDLLVCIWRLSSTRIELLQLMKELQIEMKLFWTTTILKFLFSE